MKDEDKLKKVEITWERHGELLRAERILNALYIGGVDNWEWYSESLKNLDSDEDE